MMAKTVHFLYMFGGFYKRTYRSLKNACSLYILVQFSDKFYVHVFVCVCVCVWCVCVCVCVFVSAHLLTNIHINE